MQPKDYFISHIHTISQLTMRSFHNNLSLLLATTRVGRRRSGASTGRSVRRASTATVVVGTAIIIGVVVRAIAIRVMIATTTAGIGPTRSVVVITLAVGSGASHGLWDDGYNF